MTTYEAEVEQVVIRLGAAYSIQEIDIDIPVVDHAYQRDLDTLRVSLMAASFDITLAGTLAASLRDDGTVAVVDGQQRLAAARQSGKVTRLPFRVFEGLSLQQEARLFKDLNSLSRQPRYGMLFRARLVEGESMAQAVQSIVRRAGFRLHFAGRRADGEQTTIGAIRSLEVIYMLGGPETLARTLTLIQATWPETSDAVAEPILYGVGLLAMVYGESLDTRRFVERLASVSPLIIRRRASQRRAELGLEVSVHAANIILTVYNEHAKGPKRLNPSAVPTRYPGRRVLSDDLRYADEKNHPKWQSFRGRMR